MRGDVSDFEANRKRKAEEEELRSPAETSGDGFAQGKTAESTPELRSHRKWITTGSSQCSDPMRSVWKSGTLGNRNRKVGVDYGCYVWREVIR